ncbi:beta-mannosidase [Gemmobacter aquarius]|uniref:beta-mannosidase n=1 Tax=Paragemmobacter aquarius TaxID=2169400 RepID=A0A2S0UK67_9RHOB|nr:glycoside hydrolase family 2 protein [Gemmobacter aquarius]AWB48214.1 beta-mannosidase [Gemmobacter aquarius]
MDMRDLGGEWSLTDGAVTVPFMVPGDGVTALHRAGVIADPYVGRNEYGSRWVAGRDWVARRTFDHAGGAAALVIEGLDTVAEVRLNGVLVLKAANAFRRWRVCSGAALRQGENEISVTFRSSVAEAAQRQAAQPFFVPWHEGNCPIPNGNMLRKPQCDFGWDWNVALAPFGIWGRIGIEPCGPRIADVVVVQRHGVGVAEVAVEVRAEGVAEGEVVTAALCGVTGAGTIAGGVARVVLAIAEPVLWWPAGLGAQVLHDLVVTAGAARAVRRVGLRDMALLSEPDAAGRSFGFRVNGQAVFARGANWIPADALAGRITVEGVRDLLQSAVDANMNMIRVWGGGRYEPDWFYDLCDEMGLMVWQDFMFACHLYPSTPEFLAEVDAEVRDVVARINHHACIALWCGDNELVGALGWFEASRKDRDRYLVSYDRLNRTVEAALKAVLPDAAWWPSSPSAGPLAFGDAWHDDSSGDMHFWSVWHEGRDFDHYREVRPRFCSEFGFQSYPSMQVIRRFAEPSDFNIAAPVMESHQKNAGGNARIAETMFRYFRFPVDFASFVYLSQVQQGLAIKTAVTAWRGIKPQCQGTLYWQLNDTWPVCSWSSLDHGGGWKLLHHMAKGFYAPVTVVCIPQGEALVLRGVNDGRDAVRLRVTARAAAMDGTVRDLGAGEGVVPVDRAVDLCRVVRGDLRAEEVLVFDWEGDAAGSDVFAPLPWKAYDLRPSGVTLAVSGGAGDWRLRLEVAALAPFVAVEADVAGRFSANAVTMVPGVPVEIGFDCDPGVVPEFVLRDLHAATYGPGAG